MTITKILDRRPLRNIMRLEQTKVGSSSRVLFTSELTQICHANSMPFNNSFSATKSVNQIWNFTAAYAPPSFSMEIKDSRAMLGEKGFFECHFAGNPKPGSYTIVFSTHQLSRTHTISKQTMKCHTIHGPHPKRLPQAADHKLACWEEQKGIVCNRWLTVSSRYSMVS